MLALLFDRAESLLNRRLDLAFVNVAAIVHVRGVNRLRLQLCHLLLALAQMTGRHLLLVHHRACCDCLSWLAALEFVQEVLVSDLLPCNILLTPGSCCSLRLTFCSWQGQTGMWVSSEKLLFPILYGLWEYDGPITIIGLEIMIF